MTEVNGLRLAYRGFVNGLAAGYAWMATAMLLAALLHGDALAPLRPIVHRLLPAAGPSSESAFVIGFAVVQLAAALIGLGFAYFFGRFFTTRATLRTAAPCFALLVWALLVGTDAAGTASSGMGMTAPAIVATIAYGLLLGSGVPVRGEVLRHHTA